MRDARLLAQHAFGRDGLALATGENDLPAPAELARFEALVARRADGVPVARLVGSAPFFGLDFALGPETLVPRPETEMLVERAIAALAGRKGATLLDLGTGTGCIPIAALVHLEQATAAAVDLSAEALAVAARNAGAHGVAGRLALHQGSWFEGLGGQAFDVIVSNPPYIESAVVETLSREVRDHDPRLALDGGPDGIAPYRIIAAQARAYLVPDGLLALEIGYDQGSRVAGLLEAAGFGDVGIARDLAGHDRVVSGRTARETLGFY